MPPTVILGAGIIGLSTAYYLSLSQTPSSIHIVEPSAELFSSASGFAGGFMAADWFPDSVSALGRLSFEEHARLARQFGGAERWGYRRSTGVSYTARGSGKGKRGDDWLRAGTSRASAATGGAVAEGEGGSPRWLAREEGDEVEVISEEGGMAQVYVLLSCGPLRIFCANDFN